MTSEGALCEAIAAAGKILFFTGAGISTPSGIPDFRGPQGVWKKRDPVFYQDFMSSEDSRIDYWEYKLEGWAAFQKATPNAVHDAIALIEKAGKLDLVVTQNVDGLHLLAGTSPSLLVELHGTNGKVECQGCRQEADPAESFEFFQRERAAPRCPCGGYLKPATISFGQELKPEDLEKAFQSAASCDLVLSLGSTLSVEPAASIPLSAAKSGSPYFIVNQGETAHDRVDCLSGRIHGLVEEIFPAAVEKALRQG
ncbi:MAG: Sir2 family NAD-dependent protein deacetylase [Planctomycetota bacterium]|nr:Sir2 family NAD-dependent protein deacetylase [Planctomycetota bacterium]